MPIRSLSTAAWLKALCLSLLLGLPALAAANGGLTLHQLADLVQVGEQQISPDGEHIAYTRIVPRRPGKDGDGPAFAELHVSDRNGRSRVFVGGEVNVGGLAWSPDSRAVLFLAKRGGDATRRIYRIALDGGEAVAVFHLETDIRQFRLAPDGERIAALAFEPEDEARKKLAGQGFSQRIYEESARPVRLWLGRLGAEATKPQAVELDGSVQDALWAPRGDALALKIAPVELVDDVIMRTRIHFADASGRITARVETPGKLGAMAWSGDGANLAFISAEDISDPREGRLMLVGRSGGTPRDLVPGFEGHIWQLAWRDARRLLFVSHEGVETRLQEYDLGRERAQPVLAAGVGIWDNLSVSADGRRVALGGNTPAHPRELFLLEPGARAPRRLTDSNPWLAGVRLAPQDVVRYRARDGLEIEGLLIRPLDEQPGRRYPLILTVHGGPEAHYNHGWLSGYSTPGQAAAARGFAVFYPNYRASTGRGVAFSKANHGRPAAEEFDDLVDGVDHLIELGLVDRERVGITGGSYGGYASAWGATYYSERFAAAVTFVGLSDKIAMMGTTDIPTELKLVHYLQWPWENWELYTQASPIFHAKKSRTPTLILHGDADPRVDRSQSFTLYRYLKVLGQAPVRLVLYPGEGHGNQRAASRWDYALRLMQWMEHYLVGPGGEPPAYELDYQLEHWTGAGDEAAEAADGAEAPQPALPDEPAQTRPGRHSD